MAARFSLDQPCVCAAMRMATRSVTQFYDNALRPSGLRSTQFHILSVIAAAGPATVTQLIKLLVMDQTTLTRSLALLERNGLLKQAPNPDARVKSVQLTKKGVRALEKAEPRWASAQKKMLSAIGPAAWAVLSGELHRLAHEPVESVDFPR
jgi:DNA-binding MarR family transcriptional regulator